MKLKYALVLTPFILAACSPQTTTETQTTPAEQSAPATETTPAEDSMMKDTTQEGVMKENLVEATLQAKNFTFGQDEIHAKVGDTIRVTINNVGGFHDFMLDEFGVNSGRISEGESTTVEFVADKTGEFEYYCSVGNHRAMGMKGTLIVEE